MPEVRVGRMRTTSLLVKYFVEILGKMPRINFEQRNNRV